MKLTDLKRPKPKKQTTKGLPETIRSHYEDLPYCLRFTLESPELEALGMNPQDFAGMETMTATVQIEPINIRDITSKSVDGYDKNRNQSVEFQILKIGFEKMTPKKDSKFKEFAKKQGEGPNA